MPESNAGMGALQPEDLRLFSLEHGSGLRVRLLNLGAAIHSLEVPSKAGPVNTVLTYPGLSDYLSDRFCLGATAGRYANRIRDARFTLDGRVHQLDASPGQSGHCLHGGPVGFSRRIWSSDPADDGFSVSFSLQSEDGDQGFPGRLEARVTYRLLDGCELSIEFRATSDAPTVINLANHAYFNLNGDDSAADNHRLTINANAFTPVRVDLIPSGELRPVDGRPFDFRKPATIRDRLEAAEEQLTHGAGFDHNFVLNGAPGTLRPAATLASPRSGLELRVHTTQPGLQLYTGQHLDRPFRPFQGLCLEAQNFPNAPNTKGFPAAVLRPGKVYTQQTVYEFRV